MSSDIETFSEAERLIDAEIAELQERLAKVVAAKAEKVRKEDKQKAAKEEEKKKKEEDNAKKKVDDAKKSAVTQPEVPSGSQKRVRNDSEIEK